MKGKIIKYLTIVLYAAGLAFWVFLFAEFPVLIFLICLAISWTVVNDAEELHRLKDEKFSQNHLKALKRAYRKQ